MLRLLLPRFTLLLFPQLENEALNKWQIATTGRVMSNSVPIPSLGQARAILLTVLTAALLGLGASSVRGDDFFDEMKPGLLAYYQDGRSSVPRVDADIAFDWGKTAPVPEISFREFSAHWQGNLFVKLDTSFRFAAYLQGRLTVRVQGKEVLTAQRDQAGWVLGPPVPLEFGFLPIEVTFEKTAPKSVVKLYWSTEQFALEPIPAHRLFHEQEDTQARLVEQGRQLYDAYRCNRCHQWTNDILSDPAPPLLTILTDLNPQWLLAKLKHQHAEAKTSRMPSFGFQEAEAEAIAAWLQYLQQPPNLASPRPLPNKPKTPPPSGEELVQSRGCLACHRIGEIGTSGPFSGSDLSRVGAKRSVDWIYSWLGEPDRINPQRRMPQFKLTPTERGQIARFLSQLGSSKGISFDSHATRRNTELVQRGRQLAKQARCANCHKTPAMERDIKQIPRLDHPVENWEQSCLSSKADKNHRRPHYPQADLAALKAYLAVRWQRRGSIPSPISEFDQGVITLARRNCLNCHERDGGKGIVPIAGLLAQKEDRFRGQSGALIPPNLTAVGDKLEKGPLDEAVGGAQKVRRRPWLQVQMPRFKHSKQEQKALAAYFIAHDRIPDKAPIDPKYANPLTTFRADRSELLLAGRQLVGAGGFSCIACHAFGKYQPKNVALGTRGSDLKGIAGRIRPDFFFRWTRSPLRVVPGMEMPSYEKPVRGILEENVHRQLAAVWKAINDPRFEAPTNPSQVEQLLTVQPGEAPRILRDVFTLSEENGGGTVARSLAIGFDNGHSLLFDLDTASIREWTWGDFALQRTEGKSWYWNLAGQQVMTGFEQKLPLGLRRKRDGATLEVVTETARSAFPLEYEIVQVRDQQTGVRLRYRLLFQDEQQTAEVIVTELFSSSSAPGQMSGWERRTTAQPSRPEDYEIIPTPLTGEALHVVLDGARFSCNVSQATVTQGLVRTPSTRPVPKPRPMIPASKAPITTAPGFVGERLRLPTSIMPTAINWTRDGRLVFTSLKGHVYLAEDRDGDGLEDALIEYAEGLAAPFGILVDDQGLLIGHKAEVIRLFDANGDDRCDRWQIHADGWGYSDNYHDWTTGPVRGPKGDLYIGLGSNYSQRGRPQATSRWRGKILRIHGESGNVHIEPFAHGLRYPMGIAVDPAGRLFASDQQGVANTFNEINHIVAGRRYGVRGLYDPKSNTPAESAAIQLPHPWTRSVNGIFFLPDVKDPDSVWAPFAGHGIGCEYNNKFLLRFSLQEVNGELQGATYLFTKNHWENEAETFLGPMCGAISPQGDLYIGSIHDSGWLGGLNTGEIVRLRSQGHFPNGIREIRAIPGGLEIEFLKPVDASRARKAQNYSLSGYTRIWQGSYATEDSGRYTPQIERILISEDHRTVQLFLDRIESNYVYDVSCRGVDEELFPAIGYYTMKNVPHKQEN